jgi:protein-tyrosine phosphatase
VIDLHSHILPGIDDGAGSIEVALEMARSAVADGVRAIAATPHVRGDYPTRPGEMEEGVALLRAQLHEAGVPLEVLSGGEIALDFAPVLDDDALRRFGLGGNHRYLLLEMPDVGWPLGLEETLFQLQLRGFTAVLAHPERNDEVQERPGLLERLIQSGTLVQVTAASVDGRLGPVARKTALRLVDCEFVHMLASDAHAPSVRQIGLAGAAGAIANAALAEWLTEGVPRAIVEGRPLPARPQRPARRFGLRRRHGE